MLPPKNARKSIKLIKTTESEGSYGDHNDQALGSLETPTSATLVTRAANPRQGTIGKKLNNITIRKDRLVKLEESKQFKDF